MLQLVIVLMRLSNLLLCRWWEMRIWGSCGTEMSTTATTSTSVSLWHQSMQYVAQNSKNVAMPVHHLAHTNFTVQLFSVTYILSKGKLNRLFFIQMDDDALWNHICGLCIETWKLLCVADKAEASRLPAYGQRESSAGCPFSFPHLPTHQKETTVSV